MEQEWMGTATHFCPFVLTTLRFWGGRRGGDAGGSQHRAPDGHATLPQMSASGAPTTSPKSDKWPLTYLSKLLRRACSRTSGREIPSLLITACSYAGWPPQRHPADIIAAPSGRCQRGSKFGGSGTHPNPCTRRGPRPIAGPSYWVPTLVLCDAKGRFLRERRRMF